jgi:endoglucanase
MSEFGVEGRGVVAPAEVNWFDNFLSYLQQYDLDFAVWPLVGFLENNQGDGWALMNWDRNTGQRNGLYDGNDWRADRWSELINSTSLTGPVANCTTYQMLSIDHGDYVKSSTLFSRGDFDSGALKAACPDNMRLIGLSRSLNRGLCTDATYGDQLWNAQRDTVSVTDQSYVSTDWASTYTKLQCPPDHYVIGYSVKNSCMSTIVCAASERQGGLGTTGRTMWFNQQDARGDGPVGGEWALGDLKGQCSDNEYLAGIAFTTHGNSGQPSALYCQS